MEELFQLERKERRKSQALQAELLDPSVLTTEGQPMLICRVGEHLIAAPVRISSSWFPDANATILSRISATTVSVRLKSSLKSLKRTILIAGCDPAISVLSRFLFKMEGIDAAPVECSSRRALVLLQQRKVHVAGMHLRDSKTGEFNLPFIRKAFPDGGFQVVTYGWWEQGFVVRAGNPRGIYAASDLARREVSNVNREAGAGSRDLLDDLLKKAGIGGGGVRGYGRIASGHLSAAQDVRSSQADCCVATRNAAVAFGLDVPLAQERYDFVALNNHPAEDSARKLFSALNRSGLRSLLSSIAGYDTAATGSVPA